MISPVSIKCCFRFDTSGTPTPEATPNVSIKLPEVPMECTIDLFGFGKTVEKYQVIDIFYKSYYYDGKGVGAHIYIKMKKIFDSRGNDEKQNHLIGYRFFDPDDVIIKSESMYLGSFCVGETILVDGPQFTDLIEGKTYKFELKELSK